jgi:hypothetical protein
MTIHIRFERVSLSTAWKPYGCQIMGEAHA